MPVEPLVVYDGQSAVAIVDSGDGEELMALAHDEVSREGVVEITAVVGMEDKKYLSLCWVTALQRLVPTRLSHIVVGRVT